MKTLSFAALHFCIAFLVAYLLTGSLITGGLIALIEPACNTVAYYFHERAWQRFGVRAKSAKRPWPWPLLRRARPTSALSRT
ncbi:DUF2061 domain-containing protein [Pseudomonas borbori]